MSPGELVTWRKAHGLTQTEVAEALGVSLATVASWETGRLEISSRWRTSIAALVSQPPTPERRRGQRGAYRRAVDPCDPWMAARARGRPIAGATAATEDAAGEVLHG